MKAVAPRELERVIVDTTVREKAIAFPTDSRLLEASRRKLAIRAKRYGIALRQSYAREGPRLRRRAAIEHQTAPAATSSPQLGLLAPTPPAAAELALRELDPDAMTPKEALDVLYRLRQIVLR